ncbi:MAG: hypothetical protein J6S53_11755 [Lentisphaeria bacterium]|nr:hypothetical protein [Lentisphaeria bacterium]
MMIKIFLIFTSFFPLFIHSSYLWQAWTGSRLDHWDWIFYLISIPAAFWAVYKEKLEKCDFYALLILLPSLLLTLPVQLHDINALAVASAAGVIFSAVWLLGSWQFAYKVLPVFFILLLGTPSSSYHLSLLMMCPVPVAWGGKFLLAVLCLFWIWHTKRTSYTVKSGTVFFVASVIATALVLLHSKELYFEGTDFVPDFPSRCGEFWGRSIEPDENTKRFFVTSTVKQYCYTKNNADISVLAVQCGRNIHEIHPASHCLRTSMWTVHSEKILYLQNRFAVTEIDASRGGNRILVWVWYSSKTFSTPGFLGFRRHFTPGGNYYTYQISIPLYGNIENGRSELKKFVQALRSRKE